MIKEEGKGHYVLIKDFNIFMYNHTLYRGKTFFFAVNVYKLSEQKKY